MAKELNYEQQRDLQEVHIPISLSGFFKGWKKMFYDAPVSLFRKAARTVEGVSKKLLVGKTSLLGMPTGIVLRNASRAAHNMADGDKLGAVSTIGGIAAAGALAWFAAPVIAAAVPVLAGLGFVGTAIAGAATLLMTSIPAFTAGFLTTSAVASAGVAAFSSVVSAPINLPVAWRRSRASFSGVDVEKELAEFDSKSPSALEQERLTSQITREFGELNSRNKVAILEKLAPGFEKALKNKAIADKRVAKADNTGTSAAPSTPPQP